MTERVVVAMSGGVDSSVAAALLVEQGYEVIGITMRLWTEARPEDYTGRSQCCAIEDIGDARRVAQRLGIPHYTLNLESPFRKFVVDQFIDEYAHGRTPNPCLNCNTYIKFDAFLERARALGADWIATGHYARSVAGEDGRAQLLRGVDRDKDQSYFLYTLNPEALAMTRFPVGGLQKPEVRAVAERHNLAVADKPESADICFVPGGDYRAVVATQVADRPGLVLDTEGREVGRHRGIQHFTIGQRKGLELGGGERRFVTAIDAATNVVTVGNADDLQVSRIGLSDIRWLAKPTTRLEAQLRYRSDPVLATLAGGSLQLDTPARAVAPGQAAVFYDGDRVLGGGTVESTA
ncbi:MAG: tRNA 2-thiouridine(34) synthase MnmA [Chloroflexi bacterium]|nr:tRNA 2-thiouridine(34) synthase MnmA [Chloroflexota bacterium]MYF81526.1 tRNA 2-thiouridine(34) synthase MnmA [Chloroflexota bacterium]MYI04445.1 tRNA 2-thiouridine(34) synthase MnmA [Chloroflexota bacterium]